MLYKVFFPQENSLLNNGNPWIRKDREVKGVKYE